MRTVKLLDFTCAREYRESVRGCEAMYDESFIEGNLREESLSDIWNASDAFSYNRQFTPDLLGGKCRDCIHGRYCAGGRRSYNYFSNGNMYNLKYCARWKNV